MRVRWIIRLTLAAGVVFGCSAASTQRRADELPPELEGIGITEQLGVTLPLNLEFKDERGRSVKLGDYFDGRRPVILTLNYYQCASLCSYQLNGLLDALREIDYVPGDQFQLVTLSFDPTEKPPLAAAKKRSYIEAYGRPEATRGWHFLTGRKAEIHALTNAVGFRYRWNAESDQWAHSAALIVCTPDGRTSRYLGGVYYEPKTVRMSLVEASEGRIGSLWDQIWLTCFHYVSSEGRYVPAALGIMRAGGTATVIVLGLALLAFWRHDLRRQRAALATPGGEGVRSDE